MSIQSVIPKSTQLENLVICTIASRPGRKNAISVSELADIAGVDERRTRQIVKHLIERHGLPIGSSTVEPYGYYYITDNKERIQVRSSLIRRAVSILKRAKAYEEADWVAEINGQLRLKVDGNNEDM